MYCEIAGLAAVTFAETAAIVLARRRPLIFSAERSAATLREGGWVWVWIRGSVHLSKVSRRHYPASASRKSR